MSDEKWTPVGELENYAAETNARLEQANERITELTKENAKLRAENYVLRDQGLRTYDGLAQKADRADELQRKLEIAASALKFMRDNRLHDTRVTEVCKKALKEIGE